MNPSPAYQNPRSQWTPFRKRSLCHRGTETRFLNTLDGGLLKHRRARKIEDGMKKRYRHRWRMSGTVFDDVVMVWESENGQCRLCQGRHKPSDFQPNRGSGWRLGGGLQGCRRFEALVRARARLIPSVLENDGLFVRMKKMRKIPLFSIP